MDGPMVEHGHANLVQVILAFHAGGRFTNLLNRRQEQADKDEDDRNHHQHFNEREAATPLHREIPLWRKDMNPISAIVAQRLVKAMAVWTTRKVFGGRPVSWD
jgi:hypothetical protein